MLKALVAKITAAARKIAAALCACFRRTTLVSLCVLSIAAFVVENARAHATHALNALPCVGTGWKDAGAGEYLYATNRCGEKVLFSWCFDSDSCEFRRQFILFVNEERLIPGSQDRTVKFAACRAVRTQANGIELFPEILRDTPGNFICEHSHDTTGDSGESENGGESAANSCKYANDGECDEPKACAPGTDTTDCAQTQGGQSGNNNTPAALRGAPPPTNTETESFMRANGAWDGQLDVNAQVKVDGWKGDNRYTHLYIAAWVNDMEAARWLIANGADVHWSLDGEGEGWSILHGAARNNSPDVASMLLQNGADVNAKINSGWTPLHTAARNNSSDVASMLLQNGADVNAKINSGWTPLHAAARFNAPQVAALLLAKGASVNATDNEGNSPMDLANQKGHASVAAALSRHGGEAVAESQRREAELRAEREREAQRLAEQQRREQEARARDSTPTWLNVLDGALKGYEQYQEQREQIERQYGGGGGGDESGGGSGGGSGDGNCRGCIGGGGYVR